MQDRLGSNEEGFFNKLFDQDGKPGPMLFGRYLQLKGLISDEDVFNARMMQKNQNRRIGEMAVERGWMSAEDVEKVLVYQEEFGLRFGELAVEMGLLSAAQLDELLGQIENSYVYFGDALVALGVISKSDMIENLKTFHRLKAGEQHMDA